MRITRRLVLAAVVIAGAVLAAYLLLARSPAQVTIAPPTISSIGIAKPNLVVEGKSLARVELWAIPTGTNITQNEYAKLGDATLAATDADGTQHWLFPIPAQPVLATQIFARGFSTASSSLGEVYLPQTGATELYNALWGAVTAPTTTDLTLGVGQTGHVGPLALTFNHFVQDSRCPIDAQCIQGGAVTINVTFATPGHTETKNMPSDEVPQTFDEFKISIAQVLPPRRSTQEIAPGDYRITFHIENTAKQQ